MIPQFNLNDLKYIIDQVPDAKATIEGSSDYPYIKGIVYFYQLNNGVFLITQVQGLPYGTGNCGSKVFGFHIHEGISCTGNIEDPFANTYGHYNPYNCQHPAHAGDLPPLFGNLGYAFMAFFTDRFIVNEVIGRTVIIHASPDDFTTQPSGNSGTKIACGKIFRIKR